MQTAKQIAEILDDEAQVTGASDEFWIGTVNRFWSEFNELDKGQWVEVEGVDGRIEMVQRYETVSNNHHLVLKIGDRTFQKDGVWVPHDGMYWEGSFYEAKEIVETRKVWTRV